MWVIGLSFSLNKNGLNSSVLGWGVETFSKNELYLRSYGFYIDVR